MTLVADKAIILAELSAPIFSTCWKFKLPGIKLLELTGSPKFKTIIPVSIFMFQLWKLGRRASAVISDAAMALPSAIPTEYSISVDSEQFSSSCTNVLEAVVPKLSFRERVA